MQFFRTLVFVCTFACAVPGQDTPPAKVIIPILIQDFHHHPAINITREDLVIRQHKLAVTNFTLMPTTNLPLRLGILIDTSNSERGGVQYLFEAAGDFARDMLRGTDDRVFFGSFNVKLLSTPWLDRGGIEHVAPQHAPGEGTAIYDAIQEACKQMGDPDRNQPARRVLVVISDGDDNQSHVSRLQATAEAVRSGTVIFGMFAVPGPYLSGPGEKVMEDLAKQTGGETVSSLTREAPKGLAKISELIRGLYLLIYVPISDPRSGEVEVKSATGEKLHFSIPEAVR
jgi:VWFA-related protein